MPFQCSLSVIVAIKSTRSSLPAYILGQVVQPDITHKCRDPATFGASAWCWSRPLAAVRRLLPADTRTKLLPRFKHVISRVSRFRSAQCCRRYPTPTSRSTMAAPRDMHGCAFPIGQIPSNSGIPLQYVLCCFGLCSLNRTVYRMNSCERCENKGKSVVTNKGFGKHRLRIAP